MKSKSIFAVLALAIALTMTINIAFAGSARTASVITASDAAGNVPASTFNLGDTVYIKLETTDPAGATADIEVRDSANVLIGGPWLNVAVGTVKSVVPLSTGYHTVYVNGIPLAYIAIATFFVVPESMLGTLTATVAGFAAFATIGIVKRKHAKSK